MKIPEHILSKVVGFARSLQNKVTSLFKSEVKTIEGTLSASKVYPDGTVVPVFKEENLILLAAKQTLLASLTNTFATVNTISQLQVGIGGAIDPAGLFPKTVVQTLTSLYSPLLTVPVSFIQNNTLPSITFIADVDQSTGNGNAITEAGLRYTNGILFNIKTFPAIPKTADFSIHFEWTIKIS